MVRVALVIPSIRKFTEWNSYKRAIEYSGYDVDVYVCGEEKDVNPQIDKVLYSSPKWRIKQFGKKNLWLFPPFTRHVSSIYAYILKEKPYEYDMIITVDDDTACNEGFFIQHWNALNRKMSSNYENVLNSDEVFPRGFPYRERIGHRKVLFNQGLWTGILDLNALDYAMDPVAFPMHGFNVASIGKGITVSSMNVAFDPELLSIYYQVPNYWRFDDIWAGLVLKRILDHCGLYMGYGNPCIQHNKFPRNLWEDNKKEAQGHEINEKLWSELQKIKLTSDRIWAFGGLWECYKQIAQELPVPEITKYMKGWIKLIEGS